MTLQRTDARDACARPLSVTLGRPVGVGYDSDDSSGHCRSRWWIAYLGRTVMRLVVTRPTTAVVLLLLSASLGTAAAQPPEKVPRVGYLNPGSSSDPLRQRRLEAFRQGLRELGYVDGQNIAVESRWAEGQYYRYPALAADLVRLKVDVIVAQRGAATQAAQQATRTIPIVMSLVLDPVGSGLVPSLARPGGNVTGTSFMAPTWSGSSWNCSGSWFPRSLGWPSFGIRPIRGAHSSCERRRLPLGSWGCGFKPWRRGTPRRSTVPSRR